MPGSVSSSRILLWQFVFCGKNSSLWLFWMENGVLLHENFLHFNNASNLHQQESQWMGEWDIPRERSPCRWLLCLFKAYILDLGFLHPIWMRIIPNQFLQWLVQILQKRSLFFCRYCKKEVSFSANILLKQVLSLLEINHFSQPKISKYIFPFRKKMDVPLENTLGFRPFPSRHSKVTLDKSLLILRCSGVRTDLS